MWIFSSPTIVYGEQALSHLESLSGRKACIITDANLVKAGLAAKVAAALAPTGMQVEIYDRVEPDPTLEAVKEGAQAMLALQPDWLIAVGGGSVIDAAKAIWILYERPEMDPEAINPIETLGLGARARFAAVPTTSGTGSEATYAIVLTNAAEKRKLGLGSREALPGVAILDPEMVLGLPPRQTADTGLDALTHAVEGFTSTFHNDFSDGLCLNAAKLVFRWLPEAYADGTNIEARTHLHNAATIAGLGFGNSMAALAHGMGHALGGVFHVPHGRAVALFLPYTIEYCVRGEEGSTRYVELAKFLGLHAGGERDAASHLVNAIRDLEAKLDQPQTIAACGISREDFERELDLLAANALNDTQTIMSTRVPEFDELKRLFTICYEGRLVDF